MFYANAQVNNAGMVSSMSVLKPNMVAFDQVHNVNLRAAINLTLLALPPLIKTKGNVVNISSVAAWIPVSKLYY